MRQSDVSVEGNIWTKYLFILFEEERIMRVGVASKAQEQPQAPSRGEGECWEPLLYLRAQPFIPPSTWMQGLQLKCVIRRLSILCRPSQTLLESTLPQTG